MNTRIQIILISLICISFSVKSQTKVKSQPVFTVMLNGKEAGGVIHRSDSIFTVACSNGKDYAIGRMEISVNKKHLHAIGNTLTAEMRSVLSKCSIGDVINVRFVLYALQSPAVSVAGSYVVQD